MTECRSDGSLGGRAPKNLGPTYLNWSLPLVTGEAIMSVAGWPAKGSKIAMPPLARRVRPASADSHCKRPNAHVSFPIAMSFITTIIESPFSLARRLKGLAGPLYPLFNLFGSPFSWAAVGFAIGIALGVTTASVSLLSAGLLAFAVHLPLRGQARRETEGSLFAGGAALVMAWLVGFVVHGLIF